VPSLDAGQVGRGVADAEQKDRIQIRGQRKGQHADTGDAEGDGLGNREQVGLGVDAHPVDGGQGGVPREGGIIDEGQEDRGQDGQYGGEERVVGEVAHGVLSDCDFPIILPMVAI
jgi:hypothetical protein